VGVSGHLRVPAAVLPGKEPLVPMGHELGGLQNRSGRGGEEKNTCYGRESNFGRPARSLVAVLTELPHVHNS
jgi:hypothetical protein